MSDLMLLDDYAEAVKNRDWYTCDLISDRVKPLLNKINKLQEENKLLREAFEAIYNIDTKYIETDYEYRYDMFYNDMCEIVEETLAKIKGDV